MPDRGVDTVEALFYHGAFTWRVIANGRVVLVDQISREKRDLCEEPWLQSTMDDFHRDLCLLLERERRRLKLWRIVDEGWTVVQQGATPIGMFS